eukprot:CAMPEP_0175554762 /NCGR_PEP_ID=MMETSP0096-20121207/34022_1 /TAXON_ID=311494 /ORGANISM="Alexandrium monilatum, Strain CCMP3105" /LENGTH=44 /DNA_ID= /DNA_START= /DNA_END= /DNA_ORIENTATION=
MAIKTPPTELFFSTRSPPLFSDGARDRHAQGPINQEGGPAAAVG